MQFAAMGPTNRLRGSDMWYFSWILGLGLALSFGILNALWNEFQLEKDDDTPASSD